MLAELNRRVNASDAKGSRLRMQIRNAAGASRAAKVEIVPGNDPPHAAGQPATVTVGAESSWLRRRMFIPPRI
jgi:hypothetical protein